MRRRRWPERSDRPARPKVQRLSAVERDNYLNAMMRTIERSPVLTALSFDVRILRGRFYVERACRDADGTLIGTETMGRITPLADAAASLLLEVEFGARSWSEITQGSVQKVMNAIANDTKGTFIDTRRLQHLSGPNTPMNDPGFFVGWGTLSLINAGLAQSKGRSGLLWWLASLLIGPIATLLIVILPGALSRY
jgi:hypothetical protein